MPQFREMNPLIGEIDEVWIGPKCRANQRALRHRVDALSNAKMRLLISASSFGLRHPLFVALIRFTLIRIKSQAQLSIIFRAKHYL